MQVGKEISKEELCEKIPIPARSAVLCVSPLHTAFVSTSVFLIKKHTLKLLICL